MADNVPGLRIPEWCPTRWGFAYQAIKKFNDLEPHYRFALSKWQRDPYDVPHIEHLQELLKGTTPQLFAVLESVLSVVDKNLRLLEGPTHPFSRLE